MEGERLLAHGVVEKIGEETSRLIHETDQGMVREDGQVSDHRGAFEWFTQRLLGSAGALPNGAAEVRAVGHRVVHGGETFIAATEIDAAVIQAIEGMSRFAPLHNPPNLAGIHAAMRLFPDAKHVAVFDTAFHRTMPRAAYLYALPYHYYTKHGVRRYGFHGTSHECVAHRAAEMLGRPYGELNQITAHLGNGASIAAIRAGESIDTSMGMTPLEGLVMGTRSGDIDPGSLAYIGECEGIDLAGVEEVLNWESGLRGLSGISNCWTPPRPATNARSWPSRYLRIACGSIWERTWRSSAASTTSSSRPASARTRRRCARASATDWSRWASFSIPSATAPWSDARESSARTGRRPPSWWCPPTRNCRSPARPGSRWRDQCRRKPHDFVDL
jgi:hypothetical protein